MPPIPKKHERPEKLAINIFDLDRVDVMIRQMILGGKLDLHTPIFVDRSRPDETAALFICDLVTAAAACDVLRSENRREKEYPVRVYLQRKGAWIRLPYNAVLTAIIGNRCVLNSDIFPPSGKDLPSPKSLDVQAVDF